MESIDQPSPFLDKRRTQARQATQVLLLTMRHTTLLEQAMLQQVSNPFRILFIGFASWNRFHMLGISHSQLEEAKEPIINWTPVHTR